MVPRDLTRAPSFLRTEAPTTHYSSQPFESTNSSSGIPARWRSRELAERGADSNPEIARQIPPVWRRGQVRGGVTDKVIGSPSYLYL